MAESVLSIRNLNSESITYETILNSLQFYITSIVLWLFILWSFGCDFNKSNIVQNTVLASYLITVFTKNRDWCSNIGIDLYDNNYIEYNKNDQNNNTDKKNRNIKLTRMSRNISNINQYKPTISYTLLMVFVISAVYLLDWDEKWQKWPVPTILGICSFLFFVLLFFFTYALLAVVYVSYVEDRFLLTPAVYNLFK
jgi:hypothetical protein